MWKKILRKGVVEEAHSALREARPFALQILLSQNEVCEMDAETPGIS